MDYGFHPGRRRLKLPFPVLFVLVVGLIAATVSVAVFEFKPAAWLVMGVIYVCAFFALVSGKEGKGSAALWLAKAFAFSGIFILCLVTLAK